MIHDSALSPSEALAQNPEQLCPQEVIDTLGLVTVEYLGFDDKLHVGQIVVAQSVTAEVDMFFRKSVELRFPIEKVIPAPVYEWDDEKLMSDNVSSGFNYRLVAGTDHLSLHSRGLAFDINPRQNPYIRYEADKKIIQPKGARWNPRVPGTLFAEHPLVKMMLGFGWEWGGNWTRESGRIDYQHFQKPH